MNNKQDIITMLDSIEYDKPIAEAAKAEIIKLRGLLAEVLDAGDSLHEFGEDLYERVCAANECK